ncbi:MAG TPA: hypothetical protein VNW92_06835 [Polyangiaceae bacterium]|nr:hypothetical protein [Polyangiaceae bacterium]
MPLAIAVLWFAVALATQLWAWGLNPVVFPTPDEALVRFAAAVIGEHGTPFLKLPFPDPEDLAHPRSWLSLGDTALPTYAPVSLYAYGLLLRLHSVGLLLIAAFPATAIAAFAAGVALLLPVGRRWLALLAPALGFVSLYWLLRPWMNISPVLACLCWAFFFWALWRKSDQNRWLLASLLCVAGGAAVRPDYAAFLLLIALLLAVAASPSRWKLIIALVTLAGAAALLPNLVLNKLVTGHAFRAAYQMALDRQYGADDSHGLPGLGVLRTLLVPMGLPTLREGASLFVKYWVKMSPVALLLFGQLAIVPLLRKKSLISRVLYSVALLLIAFLMISRMHDELFGGAQAVGIAAHSVPRYLAPVYLFAALPPLLFLGQCSARVPLFVGATLACALAASSVYEVGIEQPFSSVSINAFVHKNQVLLDALAEKLPKDALVYSATMDKILWSRWRVGTIDAPNDSAASINRAVVAGLPVFVFEPQLGRQSRRTAAALSELGLALVRVPAGRGLYRVERRAPAAPVPKG